MPLAPDTSGPGPATSCHWSTPTERANGRRCDEVEATLAAIEASDLNAWSFVDAEGALERAAAADVSLPLGGVPVGVKELDQVEGWPDTAASLVFADRVATHDRTSVARLKAAGAILIGLTTASEFGGLNVGNTKLNGITGNPWNPEATTGGLIGRERRSRCRRAWFRSPPAATVAARSASLRASAGSLGMKGTAGRIPRGPQTAIAPMTVVSRLPRSIRT